MKPNLAIFLPPNHQPHHPSVRLRRINLRKPLRKAGIRADLIYRYEDLWSYSNILISHLDAEVAARCRQWRCEGRRIFYCHTEGITGLKYQDEIFNSCDYIVCCSTKLAEMTQATITSSFTKCIVIPDMLEGPRPIHKPQKKEKLTCVWTGMGGNSYLVKTLKPVIEKCGMDLTIISEHDDADLKWDRDTYLYDMAEADIVLCPQNVERQPAKSHVKVATAMGLGMPLVCSPNPAYLEIVKQGINGYVARTLEDWEQALTALKNLNKRVEVGREALQTSKQFNSESIAKLWVELLDKDSKEFKVAFINNTLPHKYMSYGDIILDNMRLSGVKVDEFRYEDTKDLEHGYDIYMFTEVRFNPEDINYVAHHPLRGPLPSDGGPRVLITQENIDLNFFTYFDLVVTPNKQLGLDWVSRGFVNVAVIENWDSIDPKYFATLCQDEAFLHARKEHNFNLHSKHIDSFHSLQPPEERWVGGNRDQLHINWTMENTHEDASILDIGSADGWLALFLAMQNRDVSAVEFVKRGIDWTKKNAQRLGVDIDLRYGFTENVDNLFNDKKFDYILAYEILEHLDYRRVPWYLEKMENILNPGGKVLITLPKQDLHDNPEHLWSPSIKLIDNLFENKHNYQCQWIDIPNHGVPGNWFIKYEKR